MFVVYYCFDIKDESDDYPHKMRRTKKFTVLPKGSEQVNIKIYKEDKGDNNLKPYLQYFAKERAKPKENRLRKWFRERVLGSLFFIKWYNLIPVYLIQVGIILFIHFEIIPPTIFPVDVFVFQGVVYVFLAFLLGLVVSGAISNFATSMNTFIGNLQSGVTEILTMIAGVINEDVSSEMIFDTQMFDLKGVSTTVKVTQQSLIMEIRHILVPYIYSVAKSGRTGFDIDPRQLAMPRYMQNEVMADLPADANNGNYLNRMAMMYARRADSLFRQHGFSMRTQPVIYRLVQNFGKAESDIEVTGRNLALPIIVLDALLVLVWIMLIYIPFAIFEMWGLIGSLIIIWFPNLVLHGFVMFASEYSSPFDLARRDKIVGIDLRRRTHELVQNVDFQIEHIIETLAESAP